MNLIPTFTYIFRRWSGSENCQAQLILINSKNRLTAKQLRKRLENLTHYKAEEFEEVHQEVDTAATFDTWESGIETLVPADMDWPAVKTYREWWKEKMLTPTATY